MRGRETRLYRPLDGAQDKVYEEILKLFQHALTPGYIKGVSVGKYGKSATSCLRVISPKGGSYFSLMSSRSSILGNLYLHPENIEYGHPDEMRFRHELGYFNGICNIIILRDPRVAKDLQLVEIMNESSSPEAAFMHSVRSLEKLSGAKLERI